MPARAIRSFDAVQLFFEGFIRYPVFKDFSGEAVAPEPDIEYFFRNSIHADSGFHLLLCLISPPQAIRYSCLLIPPEIRPAFLHQIFHRRAIP